MLDIGHDTGALVVYTSDRLLDREIEIRPHHGLWAGVHTAVRARHVGASVLHAGVFGSLPSGLYDLRVRDTPTVSAVLTVRVAPGIVTETTLIETDAGAA